MEKQKFDDELQHHGIKGQKWGIRRYQRKDGTLTNAGKKRYDKELQEAKDKKKRLNNQKRTQAKLDKLDALKKENEATKAALSKKKAESEKTEDDNQPTEPAKPKQKSVKEMTDEELFNYRQRLQMEKDVYDLQTRINQLNPKPEPPVQKFLEKAGPMVADKFWNDVAKPNLNKYLEKELGMKEPLSELDKLKKEADLWRNKESISRSKYNMWSDQEKRERGIFSGDNSNKNQNNNNNNNNNNQNQGGNKNNQQQNQKQNQKQNNKHEETKTYSGTVEGEGTSRYRPETGPIFEGSFRDVESSPGYDMGRNYLNNVLLLEDKRMKHSDEADDFLIQNGLGDTMDQSLDELIHYGVLGMKWGVHRFYNKDGSRTAAGKKRENEAKKYRNQDGTLNNKAKRIVDKVFTEEYRADGPRVKKVIEKYDEYKTDSQRAADKRHVKAMDEYHKYVDNYSKSNRDVQVNYEHDYDHTKKGKKLLKEIRDAYMDRADQYIGEKWFSKYSKELANANMQDFMDRR